MIKPVAMWAQHTCETTHCKQNAQTNGRYNSKKYKYYGKHFKPAKTKLTLPVLENVSILLQARRWWFAKSVASECVEVAGVGKLEGNRGGGLLKSGILVDELFVSKF